MWQRPGISIKRGIALLMIVPTASYGAPQGGQVVGGTAAISQQGNTTTVIQGSDRAAIDWASFNVGHDELVQFLQPGSGSIALNRILDANPSMVLGRVQANGQLFLVNPRGIIFGNGAQINTAGLVASTLDITPQEFMQGGRLNAQAEPDSAGVIVNQGLIEASVGGSVTLLGRVIRQDGEIHAERGRVQLIAADRAIIQFDSLGGLGIEVTQAVQQNSGDSAAQIDVGGKISADGGYILLDGKSAAGLFDHAVNVSGIVEAKSFESTNGVIELKGDGSAVAVTGRLDASAGAGNGGTVSVTSTQQAVIAQQARIDVSSMSGRGGVIEIKADQRVGILDQATLDARGAQGGTVHVGGDYQGSGNLTADRTVVGRDTSIDVSATTVGNGGEVIVWADDYTYFAGTIAARGGALSGNGGFVEVSGKNALGFSGSVDTSAIFGEFGELLLDPAVINIINGSGGAQSGGVADGVILAGDSPSPYTISEQALEALTSNVTLTATQAINVANLADNELLFNPNGGTVTFNIDATSGTASFTMADINDTIRVNNGNLVIDGTGVDSNISFTLGNLATTTAGNITLNASATCTSTPFISACDGGAVNMSSGNIRSAGGVTINGDSTGAGVITLFFPFFIQGNGGDITFDFGDIAANGAVSINAVSNANGSPAGSSSTSITVDDILVSNNSAIQITANSAQNASLENVYIGGNYLTGGGNITISSNTLNLTANALIDSSVFGSGGVVSIPSAGNRVLNGHTLSLGVDNIYVGDISGSAGSADLGFSQADIDLFSGSTLTLRALGNIAVGNATITGPTSALQLVADRDNSTSGDLLIASGKTLDLNGRNLTASGRNATIDGSVINSGTGTEQITTTIAVNLGSGASLASGSGNISLNSGAGITMASNASISSTSGQVALSAANNIALGSLSTGNTTTSAVTVTSTAGAISNAGATTNITASAAGSRVNLSAVSGINSSLSAANLSLINSTSGAVTLANDRALQITSFTNTPATAASITTTGIGSDLTIAGNVASGSNLSLISSGAVTVNNGTTVNSNAGTLSINSAGNAAITGLTTTNNTASAVSVISGGAITDNGNTNNDITATQANAVVTLQAASGIGAANALDLSISRLALTNSTSGAANITNNRALQVNSFTNTPATAASIITTGVSADLTIAGNVSSGSNLSLTSSGAVTINDGTTVNSNAGTLSINATGNAAITGLTTTNNTASAVSVISGGAITDNGNTNTDITATQANAVVTLQAASGIGAANALDLSISRLALTNSTSGAVNITNNRTLLVNSFTNTPVTVVSIATTGVSSDLTIAGNVASGSNLSLTSSGALSVTDGFTVNSNAGTLSLASTGNAAITGLTTTNNTASAVSVISGGAITDNGDTAADITATQANAVVTLQAASGIGAANALDLSISRLALTNSTSGAANITNNRALQINSFANTPVTAASITTTGVSSDLTIAGNVASGSNLSLISSGAIAINDGTTVSSNAGTLSLSATGNAAITGLTTTNNTASAVSVISGGAITDNGDTAADITATQANAVVTLQAASGIGAANALDLSIARLALTNSTSGAANITNNRALQVNSFTNTPVTAASITTTGASSDLTIAGNVASGSNLSLISSGAITINDGTTVNSNAGTLSINAAGNAAITGLTTTNNTASAVSVISGGAIADNGDTNTDITATQANAVVTLQAVSGVGSANALETGISTLAANNTTSGNIAVSDVSALQLNNIGNTGGNIDISSNGALLVNSGRTVSTTGSNTLTLTSNAGSMVILGSVSSVTGALSLSADQSIQQAASSLVSSDSGAIALTADADGDDVGEILQVDGAQIVSTAGTLSLSAAEDITLAHVQTGSGSSSAVAITSTLGGIVDAGDAATDIVATNSGAVIMLQAMTGIGDGNAIETAIENLFINNGSSGDVAINNTGVLRTISTVNNSGKVDLQSSGDIFVSGVRSASTADDAIRVTSTGGAIVDNADVQRDLITVGGVVLDAATGIGSSNALDTNVNVLSATNSTSGNIGINDISALQLNTVTNNGGNITISSNGVLQVNSGRTVSTTGSNTLALTANAADLVAAGSVATAAGALVLSADQSILQGVSSTVSSGAGAISLTADADSDDVGEIAQTDGAHIVSTSGTLFLQAAEDIALAHLQTGNNTSSAVNVTSTLGAIVDAGDTHTDIVASASGSLVTLSAVAGIGNGDAIETAIANLALQNSTSGDVAIANTGAISTSDLVNSGGKVDLSASGDITLTGVQSASAASDAISVTSGSAIIDNGNSVSDLVTTGGVVLSAVAGIGSGNALETAIANLALLNSGSGDVAVDNTGNISTASLVNSNGKIDLRATGNIALTGVQSASMASDAISVTSSSGAIIDNGNTVSDLITTGGVVLASATGIGSANALEIAAGQVAASNTGGAIDIYNASAASLSVAQQGAGNVHYVAAGDINVFSVTAQGGDITLQNTAGDIGVGAVSSSGGNVQLSSANDIALTQQISSNGGAVSLIADNDADSNGGIAVASAAAINAGSGTVTLTATQDIALTGVTTTSSSASALAIATQGAVIDAGDSTRDLSVQNGGVVINAGSIGDGNALETRINTLDATSAGNVFIGNTGPLQIVRLVAANTVLTNTGDIAVNSNGINVAGSLTLAGAGSIDVSNTTLAADSMDISAGGDLRLHGTSVDGISSVSLVADSDLDGNGNIDFDAVSTLQGHGATLAQLSANRIALQSVQGISLLSVTGDDASFEQSLTADAISVDGATSVGSGVVLVADNMSFDDVLLGADASLIGSNVISMGNLSLASEGQNALQAAQLSATTITGTGAALGIVTTVMTVDTLDLAAGSSTSGSSIPGSLTVVADAQTADSMLIFGSINAGDVSVTGLGTFDRGVQFGSAATVGALTIASMSTTSLFDIDAQRQIDIASDNLTLGGNLAAGNAVALRGATQLATDIGIVSGRAGESTGGVLIAGTLAGDAHALTIDAGNNVMCSDDAVITSLSSLTVTDSIKTVLGEIEAQELVINARQEIYLNRNITAQSMRLDADSNNDDIGAIFRFKDALLAVAHIDASGSIFESDTRANCDFPLCAPVVPSFSDIARERMVAEQEADARESGISDAFFAGQLKVSYLDADCVDEDEFSSAHCRQKRSMYDFLGTFLINNQLPAQ